MTDLRQEVSDYYSKVTTEDEGKMKTNICACSTENMPKKIRGLRRGLPKEIKSHFYGCGSPIPNVVEGLTILDLGCGTGLDCYILSSLVGENGKVIGVDMTDDQLDIANKYKDEMAEKYGYSQSNVEFKKGYIEDLKSIGIEDDSIDIVISNCVINLSPFKEEVFKEIFRVLKRGGELYFSDIFADRRIPEEISNDEILRGECLGGALYTEDFRRLMEKVSFEDYMTISSSKSSIGNKEIKQLLGNINFYSDTISAFKIPDLIEDKCEDYGQFAKYLGGIENNEHYYDLDTKFRFYKDKAEKVCGNTAAYLTETRYEKYFEVYGDRTNHFGKFENCGTTNDKKEENSSGCCC